MDSVNLMDPIEKYVVKDDVILFEDTPAVDVYNYDRSYNGIYDRVTFSDYATNYKNKYNNYDANIILLLDIIWHCGLLSQGNREIAAIFAEFAFYIDNNNPSFDELLNHKSKNDLITALENSNIKHDDPMFMAYYRVLRSLKS